jgi:hypothetical protein
MNRGKQLGRWMAGASLVALLALACTQFVVALKPAARPLPIVTEEPAVSISRAVMFIENVGQFADEARFQVFGGTGTLWLVEDGLWVTLLDRTPPADVEQCLRSDPRRASCPEKAPNRKGVNLRVSFVGSNPHPVLEPFQKLETAISYFIGDDPAEWRAGVPVWGGVRYVDLYPGVDLEVVAHGAI